MGDHILSRFNINDESKAVHEKHGMDDGPTEEKSNPIVAGARLIK